MNNIFLKLYVNIDNYIRNIAEKYILHVSKYYFQVFLMFFVSSMFFLFLSSKLKLITNFEALLPDSSESVKVLNEYLDRMGGMNRLIVGIETNNFEAGKKFVDDLVSEVEKLPKGTIKYTDYNINKIIDYYTDNFLFYMSTEDLSDLHSEIDKKIKYERKKNSPFNLNLLGDNKEEEIDTFNLEELKEKYKKNTNPKSKHYKDGYYTNEAGDLFAVTIVPFGSNLSFNKAKEINKLIDNIIVDLDPSSYSKDMTVRTAGNMKSRVEENEAVKKDILSTVLLVLFLVGLSIFLFFLNISVIIILITTLSFAVLWAMGIAYLQIGHLNYQTAFMTSLIVGTGVNYGILYLFRYLEEIEKGLDTITANIIALQNTYMGTLVASLTTCIAFFSLFIAKNNGFSDFGFIGTIGIIFTWIFSMLLIPCMIFMFDKYKILKLKPRKFKFNHITSKAILYLNNNFRIIIVSFAVLFLVFGLFKFYNYIPDALESDFSKLRNKESKSIESKAFTAKLNEIFPRSLTPSVILTNSIKEADEVCSKLEKEKEINPKGPARTIGDCYTISSILPKEVDKKLPWIEAIKTLLYDRALRWIDDDDYDEIIEIREKILLRPLNVEDLPFDLKKNFMEKNSEIGKMAYIDQNRDYGLVHRNNLKDYATSIKKIDLDDGTVIKSSGEWIIFNELFETVREDIPVVSFFALILVFLAILVFLGSFKSSIIITVELLFAVGLMLSFVAIFDMKINFFNFIALPLTLGLSVDYSLNIYSRYKLEGYKNFNKVITNTGSAVLLCSVTTIISYATLINVNSQALASFGKLALIGELTSIFTSFFILPVLSKLHTKNLN